MEETKLITDDLSETLPQVQLKMRRGVDQMSYWIIRTGLASVIIIYIFVKLFLIK